MSPAKSKAFPSGWPNGRPPGDRSDRAEKKTAVGRTDALPATGRTEQKRKQRLAKRPSSRRPPGQSREKSGWPNGRPPGDRSDRAEKRAVGRTDALPATGRTEQRKERLAERTPSRRPVGQSRKEDNLARIVM